MAGIRCPVGFVEELIEVFMLQSISNRHRNRQKTQSFKLSKILYSSCQIYDRMNEKRHFPESSKKLIRFKVSTVT